MGKWCCIVVYNGGGGDGGGVNRGEEMGCLSSESLKEST